MLPEASRKEDINIKHIKRMKQMYKYLGSAKH